VKLWFWYFIVYSFLGFLMEKGFAWGTRAEKRNRKCFLLLPLCPVYGLGVLSVLALPPSFLQLPWGFLSGAVAATAVEYAVHWAYDKALGVQFWDYSELRGNLKGRVCLPFTLVWGALAVLMVRFVHPEVIRLVSRIPDAGTYGMLLVFTADAVCSAFFLARTHDTEALHPRSVGMTF